MIRVIDCIDHSSPAPCPKCVLARPHPKEAAAIVLELATGDFILRREEGNGWESAWNIYTCGLCGAEAYERSEIVHTDGCLVLRARQVLGIPPEEKAKEFR